MKLWLVSLLLLAIGATELHFATDLRDAARIVIGQRANQLAGPPGHVIIRVEPGGGRYWVAVTSNADESDRVMAIKGPFTSH